MWSWSSVKFVPNRRRCRGRTARPAQSLPPGTSRPVRLGRHIRVAGGAAVARAVAGDHRADVAVPDRRVRDSRGSRRSPDRTPSSVTLLVTADEPPSPIVTTWKWKQLPVKTAPLTPPRKVNSGPANVTLPPPQTKVTDLAPLWRDRIVTVGVLTTGHGDRIASLRDRIRVVECGARLR